MNAMRWTIAALLIAACGGQTPTTTTTALANGSGAPTDSTGVTHPTVGPVAPVPPDTSARIPAPPVPNPQPNNPDTATTGPLIDPPIGSPRPDSVLPPPITPAPSRTISGTVLGVTSWVGADSGATTPLGGATVTVTSGLTADAVVYGSTTTDASGHFSIAGMPGTTAYVKASAPAGSPDRPGYTVAPLTSLTTSTVTVILYPY